MNEQENALFLTVWKEMKHKSWKQTLQYCNNLWENLPKNQLIYKRCFQKSHDPFICLSLKMLTFYFTDEYNNNENGLISNHDILKFLNKSGIDETSSQISKSLPRQDTHTSDTSVDINIFNDEMRLRNNIENMYKKGEYHKIYQKLYYI